MSSSTEHLSTRRPRARGRTFMVFLVLCLVVLGLSGCGEIPIAEDMNHGQAREIVAALSRKGISATFHQGRKGSGRYEVVVPSGDFAESIRVLDDQGLPEEPREAFLQTLSSNSFLPDSREVEALRLDYALSVQLEELIENLPNVLGVRAVVRYHLFTGSGADAASGDGERAASLVIRIGEGADVDEEDIQKIVFSVIPGLTEKNLHVSYHEQPLESSSEENGQEAHVPFETFLFGWRVAKQDYTGLALSLLGLITLFGIAGALAGYWFGFVMTSPSNDIVEEMHELKSSAFQIESRRREELPEVNL